MTRLKKLAERIAALEMERQPPRIFVLVWEPGPPGPDEERVLVQEDKTGTGWFQHFENRKKQP